MTHPLVKRTAAAVLTVVTALTLSGCMKQQSEMTITRKEKVTGSFTLLLHNDVIELMRRFEEDPELSRLSPEEYRRAILKDGDAADLRAPKGSSVKPLLGRTYSGVKVSFRDASFAAVNRLGREIAQTDDPGREKPQFRIAKNRKKQVVFTYRVDQVELDSYQYDGPRPTYKVAVTMPGKVLSHNGERSRRTVTWKGTPSQKKVKVLTATSRRK